MFLQKKITLSSLCNKYRNGFFFNSKCFFKNCEILKADHLIHFSVACGLHRNWEHMIALESVKNGDTSYGGKLQYNSVQDCTIFDQNILIRTYYGHLALWRRLYCWERWKEDRTISRRWIDSASVAMEATLEELNDQVREIILMGSNALLQHQKDHKPNDFKLFKI